MTNEDKLDPQLEQLKRERGYVKASITRLASFSQSAEIQEAVPCAIKTRKNRLTALLDEYEKYNKLIMALTSTDTEDVSEIENKYYNTQGIFNELILVHENKTKELPPSQRQNLGALKNLHAKVYAWDPMLICILTRKLDMQTARAYQLERDASDKPTIVQLLDFLEKRSRLRF